MTAHTSKKTKLNAVFFKTAVGNEPVRVWLKSLPREDKKMIGIDVQTVQLGWPLGMPLVRSLENGLWEVRTKLMGARIARILFFMDDNTMVLVNGFMKKTQKTPQAELALARKRKNEYEHFHAQLNKRGVKHEST